MKTISELKKEQYEQHYLGPGCFKGWKTPYSCFKAKFYMQTSAWLVYALQGTAVTPNALTVLYCLLGLAGGIFLGMATKIGVLSAVFIFFTKGILDWSDGHLARVTNRQSCQGAMLDGYGAVMGAMGLQIGLGFYAAQKSSCAVYYYLIPLLPLFFLGKFHNYALAELFKSCLNKKALAKYALRDSERPAGRTEKTGILSPRLDKAREFINNFLDNRARTVDFICLLLVIEVFTPVFITWVVFLAFVAKEFLLFCASFYVVSKSGWIDSQLALKAKDLL
ncbi:MAG: CDP-alcohol phosphatidyltransferase family protein [Candidatus Omnitrophica bacterium]|nr:CDP-alcohol phosphatidyltransferase family protein [Candidatus Omnitrophota bacterium]